MRRFEGSGDLCDPLDTRHGAVRVSLVVVGVVAVVNELLGGALQGTAAEAAVPQPAVVPQLAEGAPNAPVVLEQERQQVQRFARQILDCSVGDDGGRDKAVTLHALPLIHAGPRCGVTKMCDDMEIPKGNGGRAG